MADTGRREFLKTVGIAGVGMAAGSRAAFGAAEAVQAAEAQVPVTATEDLMREHGLIERMMTIYQECGDRLSANVEVPAGVFLNTGVVIDEFVQSYHEMLEEKHIFPLFEKAGKLTDLMAVLRRQHQVGKELAGRIELHAGKGNLLAPDTKAALVPICYGYARMYRAHMGREDTLVFTAVRELVTPDEFRRMGEQFDALEDQMLKEHGYEREVGRVADIEKTLGIADLDKFTPKL